MLTTVALTVSLLGSLGSPDSAAAAGARPVAATDQAGFAVRKVASGWIPHWDARRATGGLVSHAALFRTGFAVLVRRTVAPASTVAPWRRKHA